MRRSFHVYKGKTILGSFDTYEQAKANATALYASGKDNEQFEITHMGLIVWGPFIVGGKHKP